MKKPFIYLLSAGLAVSMIANTGAVEAVSTDSSNATVTFTTPTEAVLPVDPREPSENYPGIDLENEDNYGLDGNVTGNTGALTLDYISNINFEDGDTEAPEANVLNSTTLLPSLQVTDRRGTGEGWNVTAKAGEFSLVEDDTNTPTLVGYEMSFTGAVANSENGDLLAPVTPNFTLSSNEAVATVASAAARTDASVTSAQGVGTWAIGWLAAEGEELNTNITLTVPQYEATEGTHSATIDWTLASGPADNHAELLEE